MENTGKQLLPTAAKGSVLAESVLMESVYQALDIMGNIDKEIDSLYTKLGPVLLPPSSPAVKESAKSETELSAARSLLAQLIDQLENIRARIQHVENDLDL